MSRRPKLCTEQGCYEPRASAFGSHMCVGHLEAQEIARMEARRLESVEWERYMALSEEERWEKVFDLLREQGRL